MRNQWMFAVLAVALLGCNQLVDSAPPEPPLQRKLKKMPADRLEQILIPAADRTRVADVDPVFVYEEAQGTQEVIVQLRSPSVAAMGDRMTPAECKAYKKMLEEEQASFLARYEATSVTEMAYLHVLLNAVFVTVDAQDVETLAADPDVVSIHRVTNFEKSLEDRVPHIGATKVQEEYGFDGTGVTIAILDSGIDYTHFELGGEGTLEAYEAAYKNNTSRDGLFPTEKVVEGYDFVGEEWPDGPIAPDDDPIDFNGHGTHCADIAAGRLGVAPGASLYAVKVCSALSSSCNGRALLQGMEYVSDPNGDGDPSDHVDIVNLSLGSRYGQPFHDDLSQALEAASALGILSVAAAGNGRERPYVVNTPASTLSALAVAQTLISPRQDRQQLNVDGVDYLAVFQSWSEPLEPVLSGPLQFGDGKGGNLDGCEPFAVNSFIEGKVVLVDRGDCKFTLKVSNIVLGGGIGAIIGLIDESLPFDSGDGGDRPVDIPAYMISMADSDAIKASLSEDSVATLDAENLQELPSQMARSSSRGPQNDPMQLIKPEIGAPGGSVSATVGTGTRRGSFGGTSAASPVVAGTAALLLEAYPDLVPAEVKARLMNSGETFVIQDEFMLAPITRIGAGEVRVDRSVTARAAAWDMDNLQGALSFGFVDVDKRQMTLYKRVTVRNYSNETIIYTITPTFRYEDDETSGAVQVSTNFPGKLQVLAGQDRFVSVVMTIIGDRLPNNNMNSGTHGDNATALTVNEFDGYLLFDDGVQEIHLPWHVLPRKAANVSFDENRLDFSEENPITVNMNNQGGGNAQISTFSLIALSENIPEGEAGEQSPTPDIRAVAVNTFEIEPDICSFDSNSFIWAFAISSWERQQHLVNVRYDIFLDVDRDGSSDYILLNSDSDGPDERSDGRQTSLVINRETGERSELFFAEHSMNTANTVLYLCAEQIGLSLEDLNSTNVDITTIRARDFRFGGPGDVIRGLTITPGAERYDGDPEDLGPYESGSFPVIDRGSFDGNTQEYGLMVITNSDRGPENHGGATQDSEVRQLLA